MPYKTILLILAGFLLQSCRQEAQQPQITAKALLDSTILAHGGQRVEGATIDFNLNNYSFTLKRDGYNYEYLMGSEKNGELHTARTFNGGIEYKIGDSIVNEFGRQMALVRNRVNSVAYDFYIPYSLTGNDVLLSYLGQEEMRLKPYHKLKVTYKQIEGAEPDLRAYVLWIDAKTFEIDFIAKQNEETSGRKQFMAAAYKRRVAGVLFSDFELYQTPGRNMDVSIDSLGIAYNSGTMRRRSVTTYKDIEVALAAED